MIKKVFRRREVAIEEVQEVPVRENQPTGSTAQNLIVTAQPAPLVPTANSASVNSKSLRRFPSSV